MVCVVLAWVFVVGFKVRVVGRRLKAVIEVLTVSTDVVVVWLRVMVLSCFSMIKRPGNVLVVAGILCTKELTVVVMGLSEALTRVKPFAMVGEAFEDVEDLECDEDLA